MIRLTCRFALLTLVLALSSLPAAGYAIDDEPSLILLNEGRIRMTSPKSWEKKEPANRIIEYEFSVPEAEKGTGDARITIMGAGGTVEANVDRWIAQFVQPDGGSTRERAKIEKGAIAGQEVHIVDLSGTFKDRPGGGPFTQTPEVLREDYRMLGAIIVTDEAGKYFVKMYGPKATVDAHAKSFKELLDSLQVKK